MLDISDNWRKDKTNQEMLDEIKNHALIDVIDSASSNQIDREKLM